MACREALDGAGACQRERTDWTFSAGNTPPLESAGKAADAPERGARRPPLTRPSYGTATCKGSVVPSAGDPGRGRHQFSDAMIGDLVCSNRCGPRPLAPWRGGRGPRWHSWGDVCSGLGPRRAGLPRHGRWAINLGVVARRGGSRRREGTGPGHGRIPYQRLPQFEAVTPRAITGAGVRYTSGPVAHEAMKRSPLLRWPSG
jgi:hypothetical protein